MCSFCFVFIYLKDRPAVKKKKKKSTWMFFNPVVETNATIETKFNFATIIQFHFHCYTKLIGLFLYSFSSIPAELQVYREEITCRSASSRCSLLEVELLSSSSELWISSSSEWTSCISQPLFAITQTPHVHHNNQSGRD